MPLDQIAFMGDDVHDVAALVAVGVSAAPGDALPEAAGAADVVVRAAGGSGAFRELVDHLFGRHVPVRGR